MSYTFPYDKLDAIVPVVPTVFAQGSSWLLAVGRLASGVSLEAARHEMTAVVSRFAGSYPTPANVAVRLVPLRDEVVGDVRPMLVLLSAAVTSVLLIACVNIANVLLVRSYARSREMAVRSALGGTAGRMCRQVLTESMLLAVIGGTLGAAWLRCSPAG